MGRVLAYYSQNPEFTSQHCITEVDQMLVPVTPALGREKGRPEV